MYSCYFSVINRRQADYIQIQLVQWESFVCYEFVGVTPASWTQISRSTEILEGRKNNTLLDECTCSITHVCTTRARKGRIKTSGIKITIVDTISLFSVGPRQGMGQSGPTAGGVDIYYYLSGHIALYLDAYLWCTSQSHFLAQSWHCMLLWIPVVCGPTGKHCLCTHTYSYTTANRIEVSSSLYWDSAACDPIPNQYAQHQCCSIGV